MSAYATISDVVGLNAARRIDATSVPNASQVAMFLDDIAAEIDGTLRANGYLLPIPSSATQSLRLLRVANARGARAMTERDAPERPVKDMAVADWERTLSALNKGRMELPDAPRDRGEQSLRAPAPAVATPMFYTGMDF